jgi:hypothetical protein
MFGQAVADLQGSSKLASLFCTGLQHQRQARQRYCASRSRRSQSAAQWMLPVDDASTYCGSFGGTPTAHSQTPHTTRGNSLPEGGTFTLEVWKQDRTGKLALLKAYPICKFSGKLGPKIAQGDYQAPEGFYDITADQMNPWSHEYLALNTGFPNAF